MMLARPAPIAATQAGTATAVFLHTGWRSRGTWIWAALRGEPGVMGFYEPLHVAMAGLTPEVIAATRPDSWPSGHGPMPPYWNELAGMLRPGSPGVPGYRTAFATDDAFPDPTDPQPELAAYLRGLLAHAAAAGRTPVFKFCRSLGRVAWMQATFPQALHAVVLRRPDAQFASARHQMDAHDNPYFLAVPLLVLARNAYRPVVAQACRALRVPLPRLRQADPANEARTCRQMVDNLSRADCYRAFLAHWTASALCDLATDCLVMDADMLLWSGQYRDEIQAAVTRRSGLRMALPIDAARSAAVPPALGAEEGQAQRAALELLQQHRTALHPENYLIAWNLLAVALVQPGAPPSCDSVGEEEGPALLPPRPWFRNPWARNGDALRDA
jgi:hypothetical protein